MNCLLHIDVCLVFKVLNGLTPPTLEDFVCKKKKKANKVNTRALTRRDSHKQWCGIKLHRTLVSVRGT